MNQNLDLTRFSDEDKNRVIEFADMLERNSKIKHEFEYMSNAGLTKTEAKIRLADKYNMSYKNVEKIVYA